MHTKINRYTYEFHHKSLYITFATFAVEYNRYYRLTKTEYNILPSPITNKCYEYKKAVNPSAKTPVGVLHQHHISCYCSHFIIPKHICQQ